MLGPFIPLGPCPCSFSSLSCLSVCYCLSYHSLRHYLLPCLFISSSHTSMCELHTAEIYSSVTCSTSRDFSATQNSMNGHVWMLGHLSECWYHYFPVLHTTYFSVSCGTVKVYHRMINTDTGYDWKSLDGWTGHPIAWPCLPPNCLLKTGSSCGVKGCVSCVTCIFLSLPLCNQTNT